MSNDDPKKDNAQAESSGFGKRLARFIAFALVVLAVLVASVIFLGTDSTSVSEPVSSSNPFK